MINVGTHCELTGDSLDYLHVAPHNSYFMVCDRQLRVWTEGEEMSLKEAFAIALRAVRAHQLRSALTMLGLIIGVSAVVLLSACGSGCATPSMRASNRSPTTSPSYPRLPTFRVRQLRSR